MANVPDFRYDLLITLLIFRKYPPWLTTVSRPFYFKCGLGSPNGDEMLNRIRTLQPELVVVTDKCDCGDDIYKLRQAAPKAIVLMVFLVTHPLSNICTAVQERMKAVRAAGYDGIVLEGLEELLTNGRLTNAGFAEWVRVCAAW